MCTGKTIDLSFYDEFYKKFFRNQRGPDWYGSLAKTLQQYIETCIKDVITQGTEVRFVKADTESSRQATYSISFFDILSECASARGKVAPLHDIYDTTREYFENLENKFPGYDNTVFATAVMKIITEICIRKESGWNVLLSGNNSQLCALSEFQTPDRKDNNLEITAFYSYKGGQGRTLALANIATCLARLGKRVAIIDMDFEAPGLPCKFGISLSKKDNQIGKQCGSLWYLNRAIQGAGVSPLEQDFIDIPFEPFCEGIPTGCLKVMPTGIIDDDDYWEAYNSMEWKYMTMDPNHISGVAGHIVELYQALKNYEPAFDHVLIDLRSGYAETQSYVLKLLPERVVCFFGNELENAGGMRFMIDKFNRISEERGKASEFLSKNYHRFKDKFPLFNKCFYVLSRLAPLHERTDLNELLTKTRQGLGVDESCQVSMLTMDLDIEKRAAFVIPPTGKITRKYLTDQYLDLMLDLWPNLVPGETKHNKKDQMWKKLGFDDGQPSNFSNFHKLFLSEEGRLVNMEDKARNDSFKVRTFCTMIRDICEQFGAHDKNLAQKALESLENSGRICGEGFGTSLMQEIWGADVESMTHKTRIENWCAFDSKVGFGGISVADYIAEDGIEKGTICIKDNFVASPHGGEISTSIDLCPLMVGYVRGILSKILETPDGMSLSVKHPNDLCMTYHPKRDRCDILFSIECKV
jgi:hypothetical protein